MDRRSGNFWTKVGGRKMANGYLAYITLTAMAFALDATFGEYAIGILAALGITSATVAYEDKAKAEAATPPPAAEPDDPDEPHVWRDGDPDEGAL